LKDMIIFPENQPVACPDRWSDVLHARSHGVAKSMFSSCVHRAIPTYGRPMIAYFETAWRSVRSRPMWRTICYLRCQIISEELAVLAWVRQWDDWRTRSLCNGHSVTRKLTIVRNRWFARH
jgi:hypothetical protein